jgi:hypothetical protein
MRPWVVLAAAVFLVSAVAGVFTGASTSYEYWGYVISRPSMFAEIGDVRSVRRFTEIALSDEPPDPAAASTGMPEHSAEMRVYYQQSSRIAEDLRRHGLSLASAPADTTLDVRALIGTLRSAGILVEGDPGYERSSHRLSGAAIEFGDAESRPLLLVMLGSGELENDHYPSYEVLLTRAGSAWQVHRSQRYFYDVAGFEFLEGPVLFLLVSVVSTGIYGVVLGLVTGAVAVVVLLVRRTRLGPRADQTGPVPLP